MAIVLTHSTEIPSAGDSGNVFCPMLERNWTRYDEHDHSGADKGSKIACKDLTKGTVTTVIASWVLDANNIYKQDVTIPTGYTFESSIITTRIGDEVFNLRVEKKSATQVTVYCNDNSVDVILLFV